MEKKTCIYLRVSTGKQSEDGYGLDAQKDRCLAYCQYRGIHEKQIEIITDGGFSGGNVERPGFKAIMQSCKIGIYERIIIYKLDRISRSIADFSQMLKFFSENDVQLVSVSENLDLSSTVGSLIAKILIVFAEYERQLDIDRTIEAIKAMLNQKLYPFGGRKPPLGYIRKDNHLYVNTEEQLIYNHIVNTFLETKSIIQTCADLACAYPKYTWSSAGISKLLKNKVYLGGVEFQNEFYADLHTPLITQEKYDKIVELLQMHSTEKKHLYLFRGILRCSKCNSIMTCTCGYNRQGKLYLYYRCPQCKKNVSEIKILEQIPPIIKKIDIDVLNESNNNGEIDKINKEISRLINIQNEMIKNLMLGTINTQEYLKVLKPTQERIKALESKFNKINKANELIPNDIFKYSSPTNKYIFLHRNINWIYWDFDNSNINNVEYFQKKIL